MKKLFIIKAILKILFVPTLSLGIFILPVTAAVGQTVQNTSANALVKLNIMRGDSKGLRLGDKVRRCEYITLIIRVLGYENEDTKNVQIPFEDINEKHWAYGNIKTALKYNLIAGYNDNTVRPDNYVTYAEAQTVLIRALGYESTLSGSWPESVINKSIELGLNKYIDLKDDRELTRGETAVLIYNSLMVNLNR